MEGSTKEGKQRTYMLTVDGHVVCRAFFLRVADLGRPFPFDLAAGVFWDGFLDEAVLPRVWWWFRFTSPSGVTEVVRWTARRGIAADGDRLGCRTQERRR